MTALKYWKLFLIAGLIMALGYSYTRLALSRAQKHETDALTAQASVLHKQCNADKAITEETSHEYQDRIANLNKLLIADELRPSSCIAVSGPASQAGRSHAASGTGHVRPNGLTAKWLRNYAGTAEKYRLQVIGLQDFINRTWAENGQ